VWKRIEFLTVFIRLSAPAMIAIDHMAIMQSADASTGMLLDCKLYENQGNSKQGRKS
jgi:hypothetical protein